MLKIPVINVGDFVSMVVSHMLSEKKDWSQEDVIRSFVAEGCPKVDFKRLGDCVPGWYVFLPTVAVEFGDSEFYWLVSGSNAILVKKDKTIQMDTDI